MGSMFSRTEHTVEHILAILQHIAGRKSAKNFCCFHKMERKLTDSLYFTDSTCGQDMLRSLLLPACYETKKAAKRSAGYASET